MGRSCLGRVVGRILVAGRAPDLETPQGFGADSAISRRHRSAIAGVHEQAGDGDGAQATSFAPLLCRFRRSGDHRPPAPDHPVSCKRTGLLGGKSAEFSVGARAGTSEAPRPALVVGARVGEYDVLVLSRELAIDARIFASARRGL